MSEPEMKRFYYKLIARQYPIMNHKTNLPMTIHAKRAIQMEINYDLRHEQYPLEDFAIVVLTVDRFNRMMVFVRDVEQFWEEIEQVFGSDEISPVDYPWWD